MDKVTFNLEEKYSENLEKIYEAPSGELVLTYSSGKVVVLKKNLAD